MLSIVQFYRYMHRGDMCGNCVSMPGVFGSFLAEWSRWIISQGNPYALATLGWVMSLGCFYIILAQGKGPMGRFILLTYNLSCLYAYSLSVEDGEGDDDEVRSRLLSTHGTLWLTLLQGGTTPRIMEIARRLRISPSLSKAVVGIDIHQFIVLWQSCPDVSGVYLLLGSCK
jgi:hypothetical protein